ncbi:hypothetical protein [Thioalbus denitrificans]|uniref:Uncharacterized protein n=1 Tax=Thioalbus denitrificans TaxID=547122 RepID=A0A369C4D3_9GAMM|nr:hypothetical protein [Thioalbus denitrificans]RCX28025.1 hypothetical protein DFQ59_10853 [Thioalbus denitrificans]
MSSSIPDAMRRLPLAALKPRGRRACLADLGGRRYAIRFHVNGTVRVRAVATLH